MKIARLDQWILGVTASAAVVLGVLFGAQYNATAAVIASFLSMIVGALVDLRLNQERHYEQLEAKMVRELKAMREELSFLHNYYALSRGKCPLYSWYSAELYRRTDDVFVLMRGDKIQVGTQEETFHILEFLFSHPDDVRFIYATSHGEWAEWRDAEHWWTKRYTTLHNEAHARGISVERVFIFGKSQDRVSEKDVLDGNIRLHVNARTTDEVAAHTTDSKFWNSMVFCDGDNKPVYSLVAFHEGDHLQYVMIERNPDVVKVALEAYLRIAAASVAYPGVALTMASSLN